MDLPKFALKHQTITMVAMFLAMVWGIYVFYTIPRNEDPVFHYRTCVVVTQWPGATASKIEQLITIPLEQIISGLDEVKHVRSESMAGSSVLYVDLEQRGIDVDNLEEIWSKVRNKVALVELPQGASPPIVDSDFGSVEAMVLALYPLYPQKYSQENLRKIAKKVKNELKAIPSIGRVQILGAQREVIELEVSSGMWSKLHISSDELALALQERNIVAPGGSLDTKLGRFVVRLTGEFLTTKQIEQVVLGSLERKSPTYLKDMGIQVKRTYQSPPNYFCRYGEEEFVGEKCIVITFTMKRGGNIVELGEKVHKKLKEITEKILPGDVKLTVVSDQPHHVARRTNEFISNLTSGVLVVIAIGFLMVGLRIALVMAAAIPLVLISSIGTMIFFGIEIEQVSIAALIVALGMLVDNAIEVSDNIHRLMVEGKSRFDACWQGSREISIPVLSATLTTVAAFLPMITIPAEEGEFVYSLPIVVSVTLLLSWLIAMTVTTVFCYWFVKPTAVQGGILAFIVRLWIAKVAILSRIRHGQGDVIPFVRRLWGWVMGRVPIQGEEQDGVIKKRYIRILHFCIRYRFFTFGIGLLLCIASVILSGLVGDQFFPLAYRDQYIVNVWLPAGVPITRTGEVCEQVENIIREESEITEKGKRVGRLNNMLSFIGRGTPRFYVSIDPQPETHYFAQIIVNTTNRSYTDQYIKDVRARVNAEIAGARIFVKKLNLGTYIGSPIALRVIGNDPHKMRLVAQEVKKFLAQCKEVVDVYDDWGDPIYQVEINVDHELANLAGVTNRDVANTMNTFFTGQYLTTFREDDHQIPVLLRLPKNERDSLAPLHNFYVDGRLGRIPIDGISKFDVVWADAKIVRRDQERTLTIYADTYEEYLPNNVVKRILPQLEAMKDHMPPGCRFEIGGEWQDTQESEENFDYAFNISLILICLILVSQYNGILKPLIILLTLPMAFAGSMFGLYITGWPLNFMAILGLVSLCGVVLNDAIVLIDFIDIQLRQGLAIREAVVKAARTRMVPILLTSFTTAGGLLPLALWGGPMWEPMAYVIIFGLLNATFLTLILIPCVYCILGENLKLKMIKVDIEKENICDCN